MMHTTTPGGGFAEPGLDAQSVFRAVMAALAEPGIIRPIGRQTLAGLAAPAPLTPAAAAILLALADFETSVWLDEPLQSTDLTAYVRFHCGCPLVADRAVASLANGPTMRLTGPGIAGVRDISVSTVHPGLVAALQRNRALFPQGVDLILTDGADIIGLPRSTHVTEG
jgi:alpha-D-ribose 1-methylphosphonate 5-triphosphate synthase subunit PhnH